MGSEPGKMSRTAKLTGTIPDVSSREGIPGKRALTDKMPTSAKDIGNAYIENKEHCANGGSGCFLPETVRSRLVSAYQDEVRIAETFYVQALGELGLEKMVTKDDELPAIVALAIDAFGGWAVHSLGGAFKFLRNAPQAEIGRGIEGMLEFQATGGSTASPSFLREALNTVDHDQVMYVIKAGVDSAKKTIKGAAKDDVKKASGASEYKAVSLDYLDELKAAAAIAFQHQAQDPPGYVDDAQLIVLFHAFKAEMGHNVAGYKIALKEKLDRFMQSAASKIGREHHHLNYPGASHFEATMRDTKVVWVTTLKHPVPVLYYYKRDFVYHPEDKGKMLEPGYQTPDPNGIGVPYAIDDRFIPDKPVEEEFLDTAIAKHKEVWGTEPEVKLVDHLELVRDVSDLNQYVPQNNPMFEQQDMVPAAPQPLPADNRVAPQANPLQLPAPLFGGKS